MSLATEIRDVIAGLITDLPDAAHTLSVFGGEAHSVIQSSSADFAEPVSADEPLEARKVIADATHFEGLMKGHAVTFDDGQRLVTSLTSDPAGASMTIGLSPEFGPVMAQLKTTRVEAGTRRILTDDFAAFILDNGTADSFSDAPAPSYATSFTMLVRLVDWHDKTGPKVGDTITFFAAVDVRTKVTAVTRGTGYWRITARTV